MELREDSKRRKEKRNKEHSDYTDWSFYFYFKYEPSKKDRKISLLSIRRAIQSQNTARFFKVQCKSYSFIPGINFVRAVNDSHCLAHLLLLFLQTIK